jgi:hypothetical protein
MLCEKGYRFPIYSLNLVRPDDLLPEDPRYSLAVPEGRLIVRAELRRRGADVSSSACIGGVMRAMGFHALAPAGFAAHGLTLDWAAGMRHWTLCLDQHERRLRSAETDSLLCLRERDLLIDEARRLWTRLSLASRLAGLALLPAGRPPRRPLELVAALRLAGAAAATNQVLLSEHGFGLPLLGRLAEVAEELSACCQALQRGELARRPLSDARPVLRGALIGDVARLCAVAPLVLPPRAAGELQMGRLFPRAPRKPPAPRPEARS